VSLLAPVRDYIDALVHPSARHDALMAARHRAFIGSRIVMGLTALASIPIYLVFAGVPGPLEALFFGWMLLPILNAYFLSSTGRYEAAHGLAALSLVVLITVIAAGTGGIESFAAIWLVVVPIEAALSASRRAVILSALLALGATCLLIAGGAAGGIAAAPADGADRVVMAGLGIVSSALYAMSVALRVGALARTSSLLLSVGEARYHLLARNMSDVITRHGRNGAVLFASPAAESLFGLPARELVGHGLFDRVHVADRPAYLTALADAAARGEARSVEFRVKRESGTSHRLPHFIWIELRCRPLDHVPGETDDQDGREVVGVMRDITERKLQEQALDEARSEAVRANAAKGRFLATITHELRTPLNAVIGFSDMLMNEAEMKLDSARRHDYARLINESGQHLLSVVNGILDLSKLESGSFEITPEPFAPAPIVGICCDILALKARDAGVDLTARIAGDLSEIVADKRALKQILLNLLSNAIKFTDRGGRVTVGARLEAAGFVLTVEDTGVGIEADDLARLGDPFFQARGSYARPYDGTGLGLSIVKGLVALHGGTIDIRSRVGEGTCIIVRLPIDCERSQATGQIELKVEPHRDLALIHPDAQVRKRA
jgi:cell cycle sensor histidine kinase DivJ